jgi:uncharacterized membrane protein
MREERMTTDRVAAFSDAVFAVIMTIMVLDLKAPDGLAFSDLWPLWPTAISYAVSYLFVAIIWTNHHYLVQFAGPPTLRLILDQLRPSLHGVLTAVCDRVDCTH